ncbi:unnamed protein product [Brassicogethes aeneus]|uniref:SAM domain-containing protein n=1 Tax=Brassicogethes aeneus TaxID=1431903 RepID=A0A9P0B3I0_BRAAE|nr:unnamed protein product [Brassicogethes aeneus]
MTSLTTTELPSNQNVTDNSQINLGMENEIILQNNSSDVTISKFETSTNLPTTTNTPVTMKTLPVVYIQAPFTTISNSNIINVNNVPQFQFATLGQNSQTKMPTTSQNVIFAPVKPQILLQKPKLAGINLAMLKAVGKTSETPITTVNNTQDGVSVLTTNSINHVLGRLPITPKTAVFKPKKPDGEQKIINFTFMNGQLQQDPPICDNKMSEIIEQDKFPAILKEPIKFPKHGISILKKNYSFGDKKTKATSINVVNSLNSVSDAPLKEIEPIVISEINNKKSRRKSNFSIRKDYDDVEIIMSSENDDVKTEEIDTKENLVKIEKLDVNMNDECDVEKMLKWEDGIGSLPGSDVKFIKNEFDIVEYVTREEYLKLLEKKLNKTNLEKIEYHEEMRCLECGCFGLPSEFISPKYCSNSCQDENLNKSGKDRVKKKRKRGKTENNNKESEEEDEDISNENSQDKFSYPWACAKKGFSWSKYLEHIKAKPAPVKLFKDAFPYSRNGFRPGMKLEGVDPQHPSYFCVLSVAETAGYRIRLHFDGYPDNYDFWRNADSMDIFPMGWCEKYGHVLQPPSGYTVDNFNWIQYLKVTKSTAAPKHLFCNRAGNAICPNGFRVGMKLEAVDRKNTALVCVASIRDMMDNRILVHFDSWDDIYDYWADPTSPYIHPVGWCDQYGHNLTPPNDYPSPETFTWETYLKETKAVAAPVRAFKQRAACGFRRGMRLECVDRRVPQLIRVATVDDVKEHQIRIHFDGWPDRYSYWVDDDCADIHPIGWSHKTTHPLEPPLTPDDVYDFLECPTVGCRGQGDVRGPKYQTHSTQKHCPYAEENIDAEKILPDRLLSPDKLLEAVVPVSREPREKPKARLGRPPKNPPKVEPLDEYNPSKREQQKPKRKYRKRVKQEPEDPSVEENFKILIEQANFTPAEKEAFKKHTKFLNEVVCVDEDPRTWSKSDVAQFVATVPSCDGMGDGFIEQEIDGDALLALTQKDIFDLMDIKLGPAIKLYNSILLLRQQINNRVFD